MRILARRGTERFDQQHLDQPCEHEVAARSLLDRLIADEPDQCREPLGAADVDDGRQERSQQRRVRRVEDEVAAQHPHVGRPVGRAVADLLRRGRRELRVDVLGRHRLEPREREARRRGEEHEVAGLERISASYPSTTSRQLPSSIVQKLGSP